MGYSQLSVGGSVTLMAGAALNVIDDPGTYTLGSRYTIVTAKGEMTGTFGSSVTYNPIFAGYISPIVTYDPNDVYLVLDPTASPTPAAGPPILFKSGQQDPDALTAMASAVAGVGDAILSGVCDAAALRMVSQTAGCEQRALGSGYHSEVWLRGIGGFGNLSGGGARPVSLMTMGECCSAAASVAAV